MNVKKLVLTLGAALALSTVGAYASANHVGQSHHTKLAKGIYLENNTSIKHASKVNNPELVVLVTKSLSEAHLKGNVVTVYQRETTHSHKQILLAQVDSDPKHVYKFSPTYSEKLLAQAKAGKPSGDPR